MLKIFTHLMVYEPRSVMLPKNCKLWILDIPVHLEIKVSNGQSTG